MKPCLGYLYHTLLPAITIALLQLAHKINGRPAQLSPPVWHSTAPAACVNDTNATAPLSVRCPNSPSLPLSQSVQSSLSRLGAPSVALPHAEQRRSADTSGSASLASGGAVGLLAEQIAYLSARNHTAILWAAPPSHGIPTATQAASAGALPAWGWPRALSARNRRAARWAAASSCGTARAPRATPARPCAACCCCTCARSRCPAAG